MEFRVNRKNGTLNFMNIFMNIERIPVLQDNYIFLLHDPEQNRAAVVDPAVAEPVLRRLKDLGAELIAIFNTHHHSDHVGGNLALLKHFPKAIVYASEADRGRIPEQQVALNEGDHVTFANRSAEVLFIPGHTLGHIAYYFAPLIPDEPGELFCGDTLFAGGCGRLFEGTPEQMMRSLSKIRELPDETRIWCAHEYTYKNLQFAISVEPQNQALQQRFETVKAMRQQLEPTIPTWLSLEKQINPFLRWDEPTLTTVTQTHNSVESFARLRGMKDRF
jgi:hydroxyacylglutathione hydrolase